MAMPIIVPVLLALGLGGLALAASSKEEFPNLPPELQGNLKRQLRENMDPASLRMLAATLRQTANLIDPRVTPGATNAAAAADYRRAADRLEARARELEFQRGQSLPVPGAPGFPPVAPLPGGFPGAPPPLGAPPGSPGVDPIAQAADILAKAGPTVAQTVPDILAKAAPGAPTVPPAPFPPTPTGPPPGTVVVNPATQFPPGVDVAAAQAQAMPTIRLGSVDPGGQPGPVNAWQRILVRDAAQSGATFSADGNFGPATDAATRRWQAAHALVVDGVVGKATWTAAFRTFPGGVAPMVVPAIGPAVPPAGVPPTIPAPPMPAPGAPAVVIPAVAHYTVAPGDFASAIAQRFGQTLQTFAAANRQHTTSWDAIRSGERFNIPPNWHDLGSRPHATGPVA